LHLPRVCISSSVGDGRQDYDGDGEGDGEGDGDAKRGGRSALPCCVAASLSCGSSACGPPSSIRRRFVGGDRGGWEETPPLRPTRRERGR